MRQTNAVFTSRHSRPFAFLTILTVDMGSVSNGVTFIFISIRPSPS